MAKWKKIQQPKRSNVATLEGSIFVGGADQAVADAMTQVVAADPQQGNIWCTIGDDTIDFLDKLRRPLVGSADPKSFAAKQALDLIIAGLHKWTESNNCP